MTPHCWWCCHPFEGDSLHWPYRFKSNVFSTTGHFCSWTCMKAYAFSKGRSDTYEFILLMRKRIEGSIGDVIKRAPPKECLITFGGTMTIEEFRTLKKPISVYIPNENFQLQVITTNNQQTVNNNSQGTTDLQLRRLKPLERSKGRLETVLNKCSNAAKKEKKDIHSKTEQ